MRRALSEAARVAKPGGTVLVQVFGRPERCTLEVMKRAILPLLSLERDAGLTPRESFCETWAYEFDGDEALLCAILSALAPWRGEDGSYRLENEWHYLVARA